MKEVLKEIKELSIGDLLLLQKKLSEEIAIRAVEDFIKGIKFSKDFNLIK